MKHRVLLVSDMHYTTEETHAEYKAVCPTANASVAAGPAFGRTQREKIDLVTEAVRAEHAAAPLDAVLILGDLSIDDYDFRRLPDNYCARFRDESMAHYPCPAYAIPGNHDSYPDAVWQALFGYGRQFSAVIGGALFVMLDTFCAVPAAGASGSAYTPVDVEWLRQELDAYPGLPVFLCAHHIRETGESEAFARLLADEPRIVCLFRGHTHHNAVLDCYGKPLFDIGGYAYNGMKTEHGYTFGIFDFKWAWGYQLLEWDETEAQLRHVKPALHYEADNGSFDVSRTVSGERTIQL